MSRRALLLLLLLLRLALCTVPLLKGRAEADGGMLCPEAFDRAVHTDSTALVIDVRKPGEFAQGHLAGARLIDWSRTEHFDSAVSLLPRSATCYIYCKRGGRSAQAAALMRGKGLTVVELEGGIEAWNRAGLPLEKGRRAPLSLSVEKELTTKE